jgi:hypothetical protein
MTVVSFVLGKNGKRDKDKVRLKSSARVDMQKPPTPHLHASKGDSAQRQTSLDILLKTEHHHHSITEPGIEQQTRSRDHFVSA